WTWAWRPFYADAIACEALVGGLHRREPFNRMDDRLRAAAVAVAEILPAATHRLIDLDKIEGDVAADRGELVLLIDEQRLIRIDAIEVGNAPFELLLGDLHGSPRMDDALFEEVSLLLSLQELHQRVFNLPSGAEDRLLILERPRVQ